MELRTRSWGLEIRRPREQRFADRGVPMVEMWASGPKCLFTRLTGVVDSGSKLTFIPARTAVLLGFPKPAAQGMQRMNAVGGPIDFTTARVQFRLPLRDRPSVTFYLDVGISAQINHALFGNDLLRYFRILVGPDEVFFLADEHRGGTAEP